LPGTSRQRNISALKRQPGIGILLTLSGYSCSPAFMSGARELALTIHAFQIYSLYLSAFPDGNRKMLRWKCSEAQEP
jgi:hypothetical protein